MIIYDFTFVVKTFLKQHAWQVGNLSKLLLSRKCVTQSIQEDVLSALFQLVGPLFYPRQTRRFEWIDSKSAL